MKRTEGFYNRVPWIDAWKWETSQPRAVALHSFTAQSKGFLRQIYIFVLCWFSVSLTKDLEKKTKIRT